MLDAWLTPRLVANLLILAFFANEAVRWRGARPPAAANDGTTMVFRSCYAIALLALNSPIPSPVMAVAQVVWLGIFAAACGFGALVEATLAMSRQGDGSATERRGNVVFWIGATAASGNVVAALTVTVLMLAATGVLASAPKGHSVGNARLGGR